MINRGPGPEEEHARDESERGRDQGDEAAPEEQFVVTILLLSMS
jgi:hypothetical protein